MTQPRVIPFMSSVSCPSDHDINKHLSLNSRQQHQRRRRGQSFQLTSLVPFLTQIAGHGSEGDGQRGFLKHRRDGWLLKPLQAPPKGEREVGFYKALNDDTCADATDRAFRRFVPKFFGVETVEVNGDGQGGGGGDYLVLEDVTEGLELPNIMDIKIGSRTWGPDAPEKKRRLEDGKYKGTKMPYGFSVLGIIVHPIVGGGGDIMTKYDKSFGRDLRTDDVMQIPLVFFDVARSGAFPALVRLVLEQMREIARVYEAQTKYHTYASSLLFAYDAKRVRECLSVQKKDRNLSLDRLKPWVRVRLIDFAHVFPAPEGQRDENFLRGLKNLIHVFESLLVNPSGKRHP